MAEYVAVAKAQDIPAGGMKPVSAGGKRLLVCRVAEAYHVIDDTCTHDNGPLADGFLDGTAIECPRHGARFDVTTGQVLCLPAAVPIKTYPVKVEGDEIKISIG